MGNISRFKHVTTKQKIMVESVNEKLFLEVAIVVADTVRKKFPEIHDLKEEQVFWRRTCSRFCRQALESL